MYIRKSERSRGNPLEIKPWAYDPPVTPFGAYVRDLAISRLGSVYVFAKKLGKSQGNLSNIFHGTPIGKSNHGAVHRPPLEEMDAWADALGCTPAERDQLRYLAERTHCPPGLLAKLDAYEAEVAALRQQVAEITKLAQAKGIIPKDKP